MDQSLFGFGTLMTCRHRPSLSVLIAGYWYFIETPAKIGIENFANWTATYSLKLDFDVLGLTCQKMYFNQQSVLIHHETAS